MSDTPDDEAPPTPEEMAMFREGMLRAMRAMLPNTMANNAVFAHLAETRARASLAAVDGAEATLPPAGRQRGTGGAPTQIGGHRGKGEAGG